MTDVMTHSTAGRLGPTRPRRWANIPLHVSGLGLVFVALGMAISALVEVIDGGPEVVSLAGSAAITAVVGLVCWRGTTVPARVRATSAFAAVVWTWVFVSCAGTLPFTFAGVFEYWDEALFESISGFTTTGSTVLPAIEEQSAGILFWRSFSQWFGGMGIVVLAVAVLPFLGVGGLELIRAEAPGPDSDRLSPRVSETAKRLWLVYAGITFLIAAALVVVGMSLYDAAVHSFTALSTGGFSPYDRSIAHFDSAAVEAVLVAGMFAGGVGFGLHWLAIRRGPRVYWRTSEFRVFTGIVLAGAGLLALLNIGDGVGMARAVRDGVFNSVAIATTTGFGTADFVEWVPGAQMIILFLMLSGGMAGSTAGSIKVFRNQLLAKFALRELRRSRHPRGVFVIRFDGSAVPDRIVGLVAGFIILYVGILLVAVLVLTALGSDLVTAASGAATALGNVGPGLGDAGPTSNFLVFDRPSRLVLDLLMLLGRLEIFPMLLMFTATAQAVAAHRSRRSRLRRPRRGGVGQLARVGWKRSRALA